MSRLNRYAVLSDEQFKEVHAACETFEQALQNEEPVRIEDWLAAAAEEIRSHLFDELLAIELEHRLARPESSMGVVLKGDVTDTPIEDSGRATQPSIVQYHARFPNRTDDIERVFEEIVKARVADDLSKRMGRTKQELGPVSVPGYEIEEVLGRGGMGVVYKARHLKLKRTVALKMVLAGRYAGPRDRTRFRIEAEAVARLSHPNIVQIHEVGEASGNPYCALEFVEGGNLAGKLDGKPMPPREAAKLVETLARAMQLAHSRNVVHRDLKPANILLQKDEGGRMKDESIHFDSSFILPPSSFVPKITDFGLARQMDSDSGETQAGAVIGTPSYMAPEQASGHAHKAGPAADVYSLGAILYDCLTGRPPFKGDTPVETLNQVRTHEPTAPSRWQTTVPLDLDTICLKCLRKEPENRYASAAELADELVRYQQGQPILARPVGRIEWAGKWVRRNPGVAASLAGLVGIILTAFLLVSWSYLRAEDARKEQAKQRQAADEARDDAQREQKAERWARYRANIAAASGALQVQNSVAARSALTDAPQEHRNWEWQYLHSQLDGALLVLPVPSKQVVEIVLSPDGQQIAVRASQIYLFDVDTGKLDAVLRSHPSATSVVYRPDGKQIASIGVDETIRLWDPTTGRELAQLKPESVTPQQSPWVQVAYSSDGRRLASLPFPFAGTRIGTSRLWDATTGKEIAVLSKGPRHFAGEFSPDGQRIAVGSWENINLCDAVTGQRLAVLGPHPYGLGFMTYSPDGKRIASRSGAAIYLWDGENGKAVAEGRGHTDGISHLRFSPDGSRLLSVSDHPQNTARLWDAASGQSLAVLAGHNNRINRVAFSPDGKRVATASADQLARLWDGITGQSLAILRGHTSIVQYVVFSPDSTRLITGADDATYRLWDAQTGELLGVLRGHDEGLVPPVFTPDGSRLVSGSWDGTVRIWDLSQVEGNVLRGHESYVYDVAFSPNGEQVASAAWDGTARLWDATTGRQTGLLKHETGIISSVAYSRDGRQLVTMERARGVTLWDIASQKAARDWPMPHGWMIDVRASLNPEGTLLASGSGGEGPARILDVASGREVTQLRYYEGSSAKMDHAFLLIDFAFHPDGNLLATGSCTFANDAVLQLWDVASWTRVAELHGHTDHIWRVAFSADGNLLASASADKTIRLWDPQTHENLAVILLGSIVYGVAFSPDGTRLAAGCADGSIRLIDVARRVQVAELRGHTDYVHAVAWSPDGTRLVSGSGDTTIRVWDSLSPASRAARTPDLRTPDSPTPDAPTPDARAHQPSAAHPSAADLPPRKAAHLLLR